MVVNILFLTSFILVLRAVVVAKMVIVGILFLTSFILALRVVIVAKLLISDILPSIFLISGFYTSFITMQFFTTSLNLLQSTGRVTNSSTSNLSPLFFKLLKLVGTFFKLINS